MIDFDDPTAVAKMLARQAIRERIRSWNNESPETVERLIAASDEMLTDPNDEASAYAVLSWIKAAGLVVRLP